MSDWASPASGRAPNLHAHTGEAAAMHTSIQSCSDVPQTSSADTAQGDWKAVFRWPHLPVHAILAVIGVTSAVSWFTTDASPKWCAITLAFWVTYLAVFRLVSLVRKASLREFLQSVSTVTVMMCLYLLLAFLAFAVVPWDGDALAAAADTFLGGGTAPVVALGHYVTPTIAECCAFVYSLYIPYIYLSIFLYLLGRRGTERRMFVTALALTYGVSFLGYLFVPAHGPVVFHDADFAAALSGGSFLALVRDSVAQTGGPHGAFPSLHIGTSWFLCFFDLRRGQLRGMLYVPLVLAIAFATLVVRYHYVVDLVAGFAIATGAVLAAERIHCWPVPSASVRTGLWRRFLKCFFHDVQVRGAYNIPPDTPVLVVSNHSNAFIDPFALRTAIGQRLRLTAKASLLRNPYQWLVMRLLGVIPIARAQDSQGGEHRAQNADAFSQCVAALDRAEPLCIFPEGKSHSAPAMLPLKSGAARLALHYANTSPRGRELVILPVGLYYEAKERIGSRILVQIGTPFSFATWMRSRKIADAHAVTEEFAARLHDLTLNFPDEESCALLPWMSELYQRCDGEPAALDQQWQLPDQFVPTTGRLTARYAALCGQSTERNFVARARALHRRATDLGISAEEVRLPMRPGKALLFLLREVEMLLIGGLLFVIGLLLNLIPFVLVLAFVRRFSKDRDHWASNALVFGAGIWTCCWAVASAMLLWWFPLGLLLLPVAVYTGYFALRYAQRVRRTVRRARTFLYFLAHPGVQSGLRAESQRLFHEINALYESVTSQPELAGV